MTVFRHLPRSDAFKALAHPLLHEQPSRSRFILEIKNFYGPNDKPI
jgi:hypothetical protein